MQLSEEQKKPVAFLIFEAQSTASDSSSGLFTPLLSYNPCA